MEGMSLIDQWIKRERERESVCVRIATHTHVELLLRRAPGKLCFFALLV